MRGDEILERIKEEMRKAVVGYEEIVEMMTVALVAEGHIMLVGIPGVAKTTLAKSFSKVTGLEFSRIQLTPDLLPADIIGTVYFSMREGEFRIKKGPIFANVVLVDEINRATPKTQSALLEAMQERQVTIEGNTMRLPEPFLVIATRNPVELEGVYKLPEAQLDRFMISMRMHYLDEEEEFRMLKKKDADDFEELNQRISAEELRLAIQKAREVRIRDEVLRYLHRIVRLTRVDERVLLGASPRAAEHLLRASKALAFLRGRDYVIPDDIKETCIPVLSHRIILQPEYEYDGVRADDVLRGILNKVEVPV
ncbi:MAG: MoxR family ATPase [Archaeoglobi archaeon]|nr:MoxR family ATPase [Candidatus Mnemosynella bozhongmuii]